MTKHGPAESELRETAEKLRIFVENAPAAIAMTDCDMKYIAASDRWLSEHAAKDRSILGRSAYDVFPDIPERWREIHRRCLAGAVERNDADPWIRSDGSTEWIRWEIRPWRRSDHIIGGLLIFSEVVTEGKRAEEVLRETAERLQLAVAAANVGLWDWDLRSNAVRFSPEWKHQLGYRDDELSDRFDEWQSRVHPDDLEDALGRVNAYLADPRGQLGNEFRMRHKDGSYRWILAQASVVRGEDGQAVRMLGSHVDITERKQAEEAFHAQAHMLSESQRIAQIGSFRWEFATGRLSWTDETYRQFGVVPGTGTPSSEALLKTIYPDDRLRHQDWMCACIAGEKRDPFDYRVVLPNGSVRWHMVCGEIERGPDGSPVALTGTNQDITARKVNELEIERLTRFYATLSQVNQAIVRVKSLEELAGEVSRVAVEFGGFKLAWVGQYNAQTREVTPLGHAGEPRAFVHDFRHSLDDGAEPVCLCCPAIRENRSCVVNDVSASMEIGEWQSAMKRAGIRAAGVFPVRVQGAVWGVFGVYAGESDVFRDREVALLEEAAMDIGYAIEHIESDGRRREAEAQLRESEGRFRTLVEQAPESIFIQIQQRFAYVNAAAVRLFGAAVPEQLLGETVESRMHPDCRARVRERIRLLNEKRLPQPSADLVYLQLDGSPRNVSVSAVPFEFKGEQGALVFVRDITERKLAETALRESEERFRSLIEGAPEGIFVQCGGLIRYGNQAMLRLVGAERIEVLQGQPFISLVAPEYLEAIRERIRAQRETGVVVPPMEQEFLRRDGTRVPVETTAVAIRFEGQDGHLVFVRDITARRAAEKERGTLEAQLRQAQKMESVGRLAGGVAHDFNNLLMGIMGYAELCRDQIEPTHPIRADLDEIIQGAKRSADITRQLLAFARKQTIAPRVLDLNDAVAGMLKLLRQLIGEDINLAWRPGADLRPVRLDPSQVDQILANLCVNSRDAIAGVGEITVETGNVAVDADYCATHPEAIPGPYVFLAVGDNGCGMDKETLAQVFEPFFTTKGLGKGTGLGLATVYGIVKQNNGFIDAYSEPGKGTTFKIYLPQIAAETAAVTSETQAPIGKGRGETILLVEDETSTRVTCSRFLEDLDYKVLAAETPGEALKMVAGHPGDIHVLLTDVVMPGMDGRQLAKRISVVKPGVKVLFMSGYAADVIVQRGVLDEGVQFLSKPFKRDDLARKVRALLEAH